MQPGLVVMTLAGRSSRFTKEGIMQPKWSLRLGNLSLLERSLQAAGSLLEAGFTPAFVARADQEAWLLRSLPDELPSGTRMILLPESPPGQAFSAVAALRRHDEELPVVVWDADMLLLPPPSLPHAGSWLLLSRLPGRQWAFVDLDADGNVRAVAERQPVGPFTALGMYGFGSGRQLRELVDQAATERAPHAELSLAELYRLLPDGSVRGLPLPNGQVLPVGTPDQLLTAAAILSLPAPELS